MKISAAGILLLALPAFAAVDGTVINKTTGKPQPGATVTLYKLGQAGMESVESVKSGPGGQFRIDRPTAGPHLIQTAFDGVTYNHLLPPGAPASGLSLEVYNSSKQPGAARVARHFVIFQPSGGRLGVNEGFVFNNDGATTYNDPDGGTLKFYLPPAANGAAKVKATAPQGMPIDRAAEKTARKDIYKIDFPIKPGETDIQITYDVPYTSGGVFEGKVIAAPQEATLLVVPDGIAIKGEGLESKGQEPRSKAAVYSVKSATYKVEISGDAPAPAADSDSADSGPSLEEVSPKVLRGNMKWILGLAFAILALGFIVLYRAPIPNTLVDAHALRAAAAYLGFMAKAASDRPSAAAKPLGRRGPPTKSAWRVTNPNIPCKRPFNLLQRVFVFTSGDANALGAGVLAGYLQDAAENTLEEVVKQVGAIEFVSHSTVEAEIDRTKKIPEAAFQAMSAIAPALVAQARSGAVGVCVRTLDDPDSGQSAALFLLYLNA